MVLGGTQPGFLAAHDVGSAGTEHGDAGILRQAPQRVEVRVRRVAVEQHGRRADE